MTDKTVEQAAREAAALYGMRAYGMPVEVEDDCFCIGYVKGHASRDEEVKALRAKLAEAEKRYAEPCQECRGQGMIESVGMEHGSGCDDSSCCSDCPVPVQIVEPCSACGGYGAIIVDDTTKEG